MRKIVNPKEEIRLEAVVEKDGIGFMPAKIAGPLLVGFKGQFVTSEEGSGELKYKKLSSNRDGGADDTHHKSEMHQKIRKSGFRVLIVSVILIFATLAMMFASIALPNGEILANVWAKCLYLLMIVLVLPQAFAILLGRIFRKKDVISFSKYLAAKNAVENAYYDLGRAPNMEEVEKYSIFAAEDKYTQNVHMAALWVIICVVSTFFSGLEYWLITICAILILCALEWNHKLSFIQAMVVSKPDEIHYKVAIAAMEEAADILSHFEVHFEMIEMTPDPENFDEEECSAKDCPAYDFCKEESQKMVQDKSDNNSDK